MPGSRRGVEKNERRRACCAAGRNAVNLPKTTPMMFSDLAIEKARAAGAIEITPWRPECLGPNSYDVHLGKELVVYTDEELDCAREPKTRAFEIPPEGYVLQPGTGYLGVTEEYVRATGCVPCLDGRSSLARLFLNIHATAGWGDEGSTGHWTLELSVVQPLRVYAGQPIGQFYFFALTEPPRQSYGARPGANYYQQENRPLPSRLHLNPFFAKRKK